MRRLSLLLGVVAGLIGLGVASSLILHRVLASENYYPQYLNTPLLWFALGVLQVALFSLGEIVVALRRSDEVRAATLWAIALVFLIQGLFQGLALDVIGVWLFYAGVVGVLAAAVASLEAPRKLRTLGFTFVAVILAYGLVWVLTRLTTLSPS